MSDNRFVEKLESVPIGTILLQ